MNFIELGKRKQFAPIAWNRFTCLGAMTLQRQVVKTGMGGRMGMEWNKLTSLQRVVAPKQIGQF